MPSVSQDITDAIHAERADVNADPERRASSHASTDSVLRLIVDIARGTSAERRGTTTGGRGLRVRELVRRGLRVDSLLRAYTSARQRSCVSVT